MPQCTKCHWRFATQEFLDMHMSTQHATPAERTMYQVAQQVASQPKPLTEDDVIRIVRRELANYRK